MSTVKALQLTTRLMKALKTQPHSAKSNCLLFPCIWSWYKARHILGFYSI